MTRRRLVPATSALVHSTQDTEPQNYSRNSVCMYKGHICLIPVTWYKWANKARVVVFSLLSGNSIVVEGHDQSNKTSWVTCQIRQHVCHKCLIEPSPNSACRDIWAHLLRLVGLYDPSQFPPAEKDFPAWWQQAAEQSQVRARFWTPGQILPQLLPPRNIQTQVFGQDLKPKPSSVNCSTSPNPISYLALNNPPTPYLFWLTQSSH